MMTVRRCSAPQKLSPNVICCCGIGQIVRQFDNCHRGVQQSVLKIVLGFLQRRMFGLPIVDTKGGSFPFSIRRSGFDVRCLVFYCHVPSFNTPSYACEYAVNTSSMSGSTQRSPNNFKSGKGQFVCQVSS